MPDTRVILIGAGGHARVIIDAFLAARSATVVGALDADKSKHGTAVYGVPVIGPETLITDKKSLNGATAYCLAIGSAHDARHRAALDAHAREHLPIVGVRHPAAVISKHAEIGAGAVILAGAIIQAGATVGRNTIINTRAIVEHDATIADHTHISPGAIVLGAATVGESCHIGAGSVVLQGLTVGPGAVVAAGAVVTNDVGPRQVVAGVPARVLRTLDD